MIAISQNINLKKIFNIRCSGLVYFDKTEITFRDKLFNYIKKNKNETIIIDSELCLNKDSKYQDLEGVKLAYELRTNPDLFFKGCIMLFGFLKFDDVMKNPYSCLISKDNNVLYFRYPDEIDFNYKEALNESEWLLCVDRLDLLFITEFRKFEHSFQNVRVRKTDNFMEKYEELLSYFNTLNQIERTSMISKRYLEDFSSIKIDLKILIKNLKSTEIDSFIKQFNDLKSRIKIFKMKYTK